MNNIIQKQIQLLFVLLIVFVVGCSQTDREDRIQSQRDSDKVGYRGIVFKNVQPFVEDEVPCESERIRKERMERLDKQNMLYTGKVSVDKDAKMLEPPEHIAHLVGKEFTVAQTSPEIEFAVIPVKPQFLPRLNVQPESSGWWANYCQANYYPGNGKFYTAVGDHGTYDAHIYIVEYDPAAKKIQPQFVVKPRGRGDHRGVELIEQRAVISRGPSVALGRDAVAGRRQRIDDGQQFGVF